MAYYLNGGIGGDTKEKIDAIYEATVTKVLKRQTKSFSRGYLVSGDCVADTLVFDELTEVIGICDTSVETGDTSYNDNVCVGGSGNGIKISGNEVIVYSCQSLGGGLTGVTVSVTAIGY